MTKRNTILFISFLLLSGFYMACNKNNDGRSPCLEPRRYFLKLQTMNAADTGSAGVAVKLPSPIVGYVDTSTDSFYYGNAAVSDFQGPLSAIADSTRWFIMPDTNNRTLLDTITFYYERKPVFLSTACGYAMVYSLEDIVTTNYAIDSARIEKTEVTNATDVIHVKVFYKN